MIIVFHMLCRCVYYINYYIINVITDKKLRDGFNLFTYILRNVFILYDTYYFNLYNDNPIIFYKVIKN